MRCFEVFMKYTSGRSVSVSPRKNLTTWVQPPLLDAKTSESAVNVSSSGMATAPSLSSMAVAGFTGFMFPKLSSSVRSSMQSPSTSAGSAMRYFSTR